MTEATGQPSSSAQFPIKWVENIDWWLVSSCSQRWFCVWSAPRLAYGTTKEQRPCNYEFRIEDDPVDFISKLYHMKIGALGSYWEIGMPIEYQYAKIKLGDIFDYYTTSDGFLMNPPWSSFKYAVDEYLEEHPRFKFHPSRVRRFIEENGIDNLELMEETSLST